jgi:hypothetical protein
MGVLLIPDAEGRLACAHFPADIGHRRPALDLPERVHNRLLADFDRFMVPRFVIWSGSRGMSLA